MRFEFSSIVSREQLYSKIEIKFALICQLRVRRRKRKLSFGLVSIDVKGKFISPCFGL